MTAHRIIIFAILLSVFTHTTSAINVHTTVDTAFALTDDDKAANDPLSQSKIPPSLRTLISTLDPQAKVGVIVRFNPRNSLTTNAQAKSTYKADRAAALTEHLQQTADRAQKGARAYLNLPQNTAETSGLYHLWMINALALQATPRIINELALRPEVNAIQLDEWRQWITPPQLQNKGKDAHPQTQTPDDLIAQALSKTERAVAPDDDKVAWGVAQIGAERVWRGLGVYGKGIVVGHIDTGVDWNHPALKTRYRGYDDRPGGLASHLHSWYDPTNETALYPADVMGHGTHTLGSIVGEGGVGVAPGAKWIAAKGFNALGQAPLSWLHRALQWMLAPGGRPEYAPDVVNCSWGNNNPALEFFDEDLERLYQAGIIVVFSAGNSGPMQGSVASPASRKHNISVGASDSEDEVANFSSRGPTPEGEIRPHLVAPGVSIVSTFPGGNYVKNSGTSQAAPHVSGAIALLLSAQPSLDITATLNLLTQTAVPIGTGLPNNDAGWGRIDVYAAALSLVKTGALKGTVLDRGQPISGAKVTAVGDTLSAYDITDENGQYLINVKAGSYTLKAAAYGYADSYSNPRFVATGNSISTDLKIERVPSGVVRGTVIDAITGEQIHAVVRVLDTPRKVIANQNCFPCRFYLDVPTGEYVIEARITGYGIQTRTLTIENGVVKDVDFAMNPIQKIAFVDSGGWYFGSVSSYYTQSLEALGLSYDIFRIKQLPRDVISTTQLLPYDTIIWSSPNDAPSFTNADEVISDTLAMGKNLLLSGQDIAYYDGGGRNAKPYFDKINAWFVADNEFNLQVEGLANGPLAGKVFTITEGDGANNQSAPDVVRVRDFDHGRLIANYSQTPIRSTIALTPAGQLPSFGAGIYSSQCLTYNVAFLPFGFEAINTFNERNDTLKQILDSFEQPRPTTGVEMIPLLPAPTGAAIGLPGTTVTHSLRIRHTGEAGKPETFSISFSDNKWDTKVLSGSQNLDQVTLKPCQSMVITLTVSIPENLPRNTQDQLKVNITSRTWEQPHKASLGFVSKTPAGILLVDDDRFYERQQDYLDAIAATGSTVDRWDTRASLGSLYSQSPSENDLRMYPLVVWFNAYDWFNPITPFERDTIRGYLNAGGRMFISSQAMLHYSSGDAREDPLFDRDYLGISYINFAASTTQIVGVPSTALGEGVLAGSFMPFPYNFNLSTAIQPNRDAEVVVRGENGQPYGLARAVHVSLPPNEPTNADLDLPPDEGVISQTVRPPLPLPISNESRIVFFPFAFEALNRPAKTDLMNRIVGWLSPLGKSSITSSRSVLNAGDLVRYDVHINADEVLGHYDAMTRTRMAVSVTLPSQIKIISHTLPAGALSTGWVTPISQGQSHTWHIYAQHVGDNTSTTPEVLTATVNVALPDLGIRFKKPSVVRVNTPALQPRINISPHPLAWRSRANVTIHLRNNSAVDAQQVHMQNPIPPRINVISSSLSIIGTSVVAAPQYVNGNITWLDNLAAGEAITVSYQISLPRLGFGTPMAFFNQVMVDQPNGATTQAGLWIEPEAQRVVLPVIRAGSYTLTDTTTVTPTIN